MTILTGDPATTEEEKKISGELARAAWPLLIALEVAAMAGFFSVHSSMAK